MVWVNDFLSPTVFPVNVYLLFNGIVALGLRGYQKAEVRIIIIEIRIVIVIKNDSFFPMKVIIQIIREKDEYQKHSMHYIKV
jgi:hypothetical protein